MNVLDTHAEGVPHCQACNGTGKRRNKITGNLDDCPLCQKPKTCGALARCEICEGIHPGFVCPTMDFIPDKEWKRIRRESIPKMFERQRLRREGKLNRPLKNVGGINGVIKQLRRLGKL